MGKAGAGGAMSLFEHFVADCAIKHNAAIKAALAVDPATLQNGRSSGESDVSKLSVALIVKLHALDDLVRTHGADVVFGPRSMPISDAEKAAAKL